MNNEKQLDLFPELNSQEKIVNVASVAQLSPFRYPGGKTWLVPRLRQWLTSLQKRPALLVEPFGGGAIISLTVAAEDLADHVILVELDEDVAAVWQTILSDDLGAPWLAERIMTFKLTSDNLKELLAHAPQCTRERAFQTIIRNRVNRGGILAAGAGMIKYGEDGKGLLSRWYPQTLHDRILRIAHFRERITFLNADGIPFIHEYSCRQDTVFFIDPPYTVSTKRAGSRLYNHFEVNHELLFTLTSQITGDFLMTYDNAKEVVELAQKQGFDFQAVAMKNTHHQEMTELLIGRDLSWSRT